MEESCRLGDRMACDALEFELGRPPRPGGSRSSSSSGAAPPPQWVPTRTELAWALLPLVLLAVASRLWSSLRRRRAVLETGVQGTLAALRSRRLAALSPRQRHLSGGHGPLPADQPGTRPPEQQQQPPEPPPPALPAHPAVVGTTAAGPSTAGAAPRPASTGCSLLAAVDGALSSLLVLPLSLLQHARHLASTKKGEQVHAGGAGKAAAAGAMPGPQTPDAALASPASQKGGGSTGGRIYGLGLGEAESEEDEWGEEGGESDLTQACLRRLQQSAEFKAYMKARGLTATDVGNTRRRLRLYRRLRRMDPAAFWQLLRPASRVVFDSKAPSRLRLAADYLLSSALNLAAAAALCRVCWGGGSLAAELAPAARAGAAVAVLWAPVAQWLRARPTAGRLFGLWYEEEAWGHPAPAWRSVAASLAEVAYIVLSAGLGLLISLCLRCLHKRRQSVGEMLAAVHAVQEVAAESSWQD